MKKTTIDINNLEVRMAEPNATIADSNTVYGRAISYEVPSDNLRFVEIIHRGAVDDELLQNSDVYCRVNHSDDYIVARSNRGKGSLHLENRADGLYYSFEVPNTEKGRELAEHIRRGEITSSSFSFVVDADGETWSKRNGKVYHEVNKIAYLHDVAPVYLPAYNSSSCSMRAAEILDKMENEQEDTNAAETTAENKVKKVVETTETNTVTTVTKTVEEVTEKNTENDNTNDVVGGDTVNTVGDSQDNEQRAADEETEVKKDDDEQTEETTEEVNEETTEQVEEQETEQTTTEEETTEDTTEEDEEDKDKKINNRNITCNMKTKKFSIVNAINNVVANKPLTGAEEAVNRAGQADLTGAKMGYTGSICLPLNNRAAISVETEGELVPVEVWDIMGALYGNNVLVDAGARVLEGLTSDVVLPSGNPASVFWEGENDEAQDGNITFSSVKLQPKRLCCTVQISKKLLVQAENSSVEAYVRQTIIDALKAKIEETVLGDAAGTTEMPAGIRYGLTPVEVADFADLVAAEAEVDDLVSTGDNRYILSNKAKAALRSMTKGQGNGLVYENGEVDGTRAHVTAHIDGKNFIYGDMSSIVIANFGAVDIEVLPEPKYGAVSLTLNAYVDVAYTRDGAVIAGEITEE